ncbi:hypothetical protein ABZW30_45300 [Kitasatospora sp. NPDC004669]|uniref:hypothetical protein n=1 Tax=Kitasatospora sp. NPDC004669 TaxID=3154555 RepID=UPI00339E32A4
MATTMPLPRWSGHDGIRSLHHGAGLARGWTERDVDAGRLGGPGQWRIRFRPGATVMRRDIHADRVWSAQPHRTISDTGTLLELGYWPGINALAPTTWTTALRTGDDT